MMLGTRYVAIARETQVIASHCLARQAMPAGGPARHTTASYSGCDGRRLATPSVVMLSWARSRARRRHRPAARESGRVPKDFCGKPAGATTA